MTQMDDSRALVMVQPARQDRAPLARTSLADAGFLAQLLAVRHDMPAQRRLRRTEASTATSRYAAISGLAV
jgi:hypothetical protein